MEKIKIDYHRKRLVSEYLTCQKRIKEVDKLINNGEVKNEVELSKLRNEKAKYWNIFEDCNNKFIAWVGMSNLEYIELSKNED